MLKNLLLIPDTFEPDERRRRQVLNVLLIFCITMIFIGTLLTLLAYCNCTPIMAKPEDKVVEIILIPLFTLVVLVSVLFMNRSARVPSWLSGAIFVLFFLGICILSDTPSELYNGRSTLIFAIPIMLGAMLFPPSYAFLVALLVCVLMQLFTPPDPRYPVNSVNYYSMLTIFFIAAVSWLGMSMVNRAIRDARRQADDAHHQAANLQAILNSIADGVLVLDLQGNFISANPALLRMISEDKLREIISNPLAKNIQWKRKVFIVKSSPVPDVGSVVVFRDETRRHETERAKDALLATASHELRTPLSAVMNYLELIQVLIRMGKIESDEFTQYVARAVENSRRLHHLVNNILDRAQIQAGMLELKQQFFNLPALLEKTHQFLDALLKEKGLSYTLNVAEDVPTEIMGDQDRLHQVLANLIGNAVKFTDQGGIRVNVFLSQIDTLSIEVADTGLGIPEERLPDIFEAFRRGSDYAQREHQGAGLGLSIAKEIIIRMGGEISVASVPGAGSAFTVSLPLDVSPALEPV